MSLEWMNWCRFCGSTETTTKYECATGLEHIIQNILMINLDGFKMPEKICETCISFLNEISSFAQTSRKVNKMFLELISATPDQKSIFSIRTKYGLKVNSAEISKEANHSEDYIKEENDDNADNILPHSPENNLESVVSVSVLEPEDYSTNNDDIDDIVDTDEVIPEMTPKKKKKSKKDVEKPYEKNESEKLYDFICHICKKEFQKMCFLSKHCQSEHKCQAQVACICGKSLTTWRALMSHKIKHFPESEHFECHYCGDAYFKKSNLEAHMKSKHINTTEDYICLECGKHLKNWRTLKHHRKTHLPSDMKKGATCPICNKNYVTKNTLQLHINSVHKKENSFTCETCGKSFTSKGNLSSHRSTHISEKTVPCNVCGMKFKCAASLRSHRRIHREKIFACTKCDKKYPTITFLNKHMVTHSDERKFKCTLCPMEYKRSKNLKYHMNLHAGNRQFECEFCDRSFINFFDCKQHTLKHHKAQLPEGYEFVKPVNKSTLK